MLPLASRRILITRSRHQASSLAHRLEALGAEAILIPTIDIAPPESFATLDAAIATLNTFDWLILTSANAVHALRDRAVHHPGHPLAHPQTAVIGPATAHAARETGLLVTLVPPRAVAESLIEALLPRIVSGTRVLLVRAAAARDALPDALTAAGARVTIAEAYRTLIPKDSIATLQDLFAEPGRHPDAITFTSSSTATNLLALLEAAHVSLPREIIRASIGPVTTQTLLDLDLPPHLESPEATILSLAQSLAGYFQAFPPPDR